MNDSGRRRWLARLPFVSRFSWFNFYMSQRNVWAEERPDSQHFYPCPCCGSLTLPTRGDYDLCPVCFWEDDGQDDHDAEEVRRGPNGLLSLTEARANYAQFGACDQTFLQKVRPPRPEERPVR